MENNGDEDDYDDNDTLSFQQPVFKTTATSTTDQDWGGIFVFPAEIEKPLAFATATSSLVTCTLRNKTRRLEDEFI